jgi:hypothetical protein
MQPGAAGAATARWPGRRVARRRRRQRAHGIAHTLQATAHPENAPREPPPAPWWGRMTWQRTSAARRLRSGTPLRRERGGGGRATHAAHASCEGPAASALARRHARPLRIAAPRRQGRACATRGEAAASVNARSRVLRANARRCVRGRARGRRAASTALRPGCRCARAAARWKARAALWSSREGPTARRSPAERHKLRALLLRRCASFARVAAMDKLRHLRRAMVQQTLQAVRRFAWPARCVPCPRVRPAAAPPRGARIATRGVWDMRCLLRAGARVGLVLQR